MMSLAYKLPPPPMFTYLLPTGRGPSTDLDGI